MGITHFTGLGKSPGAVTSGLSYIKHEYGERTKYGAMVERVIIFTSKNIVDGKEKAIPSVYNEYMTREWKKDVRSNNSLEIVEDFLKCEFSDIDIRVYVVDVNDFEDCFRIITQALLKFHPRGKTGKHIWVNITGGTNILNAALMQVVYLSGFIPVMYYTFIANLQQDGKYLQPFSGDEAEFLFKRLDVFKTNFDIRFRYILEKLENIDEFINDQELLSRLKNCHPDLFERMDITLFRRDYLNIMDGWCLEREESNIRINNNGKNLLSRIRSPLFSMLVGEEYSRDTEKLTAELKDREIRRS